MYFNIVNKGNNKITELRTILQREATIVDNFNGVYEESRGKDSVVLRNMHHGALFIVLKTAFYNCMIDFDVIEFRHSLILLVLTV